MTKIGPIEVASLTPTRVDIVLAVEREALRVGAVFDKCDIIESTDPEVIEEYERVLFEAVNEVAPAFLSFAPGPDEDAQYQSSAWGWWCDYSAFKDAIARGLVEVENGITTARVSGVDASYIYKIEAGKCSLKTKQGETLWTT